MRRIIMAIAICFAPWAADAQIQLKFKVQDAATGKALPYAAAYCQGSGTVVAASKSGEVIMQVPGDDSLKIMFPGREPQTVATADLTSSKVVKLVAQAAPAAPGGATPGQVFTEFKNGDRKGNSLAYRWLAFATRVYDPDMAGRSVAKITVEVTSDFNTTTSFLPNKVFLRVWAVGPDGMPGADLLKDNVEVDPYLCQVLMITTDVSKYGLTLPAEGFFVGVETIPVAQTFAVPAGTRPWPYLAMSDEFEECFTLVKESPDGGWRPNTERLKESLSMDMGGTGFNTLESQNFHNAAISVVFAKDKKK